MTKEEIAKAAEDYSDSSYGDGKIYNEHGERLLRMGFIAGAECRQPEIDELYNYIEVLVSICDIHEVKYPEKEKYIRQR